MSNWTRRLLTLAVAVAALSTVGTASAANVIIGTFDTGIDIEALVISVVAVFAPLLLFVLTAKFGMRLVKSVARASGSLFKA